MASNSVKFNIEIGGTAYTGIAQLSEAMDDLSVKVNKTQGAFNTLGDAGLRFNAITDFISNTTSALSSIAAPAMEAETQLQNLKTLYRGNAEGAKDMYDRISKYGKETPHDKAGLIEAQKTMMSFGNSGGEKVVRLRDTERKEDARYYVTGVEIEFGQNGAKRKVKLGRKLTY